MSRLGRKPIDLPEGVEVKVETGSVTVKGKNGELSQEIVGDIQVVLSEDGKQVVIERSTEDRPTRSKHGLYRSLIANMVEGVSKGFAKDLLLEGVGYRVAAQGQKLTFALGFCHPIEYWVHPDVKITVDGNTKLKLECFEKQLLGQVAAEIRALRKPEPYKGKGIRYADEVIRKKLGKAAAK
jgi:large subunit ribosomal protein L6